MLVERKKTSPDDASAAASAVWAYLSLHPDVPMYEATGTQLLRALSGRPDLVVDVIRALHRGDLTIRADSLHFATALLSLAATGDVERVKVLYGLIADQPDFGLDPYVVTAMLTATTRRRTRCGGG